VSADRRWTRRAFLRATAGVAGTVTLGALGGGLVLRGDVPVPLAVRLGALLPERASAVAVGAAYLDVVPDERAIGRLLASLEHRVRGLERIAATTTDAELRALLAAASQADFAAGDTIRVRGWILSRSEARVCALASLTARA
jgi:hypothetical protein